MGKIEVQSTLPGHMQTTEFQNDEFFPKYELDFGMPDIPIKPKLFRFEDTDPTSANNNLHKYDYSSIEMIQE